MASHRSDPVIRSDHELSMASHGDPPLILSSRESYPTNSEDYHRGRGKCLIARSPTPHTHTMILLHGQGDDGYILKDMVLFQLAKDGRYLHEIFPEVKFVFPYAEQKFSCWFDIGDFKTRSPEFRKNGLRRTYETMNDLIHQEAKLVGYEKIILGGFGQGAATAITCLLLSGLRLGGFIGLSGWLPFDKVVDGSQGLDQLRKFLFPEYDGGIGLFRHVPDLGKSSMFETPLLIEHCKDNYVVPVANATQLQDTLTLYGFHPTLKLYDNGGYWVNHELKAFEDMVDFIRTCISGH